jgi:ubiquinone/menaquinone biosynthesis C-methylase UbiE
MSDATRFQFTNASVPKAYDEFFVPRLFEPWAKLLLEKVKLQSGEVVLDIATGPGTVARLAAVGVGPSGRVVATDIAPLMLDIARAKPVLAGAAPIEYLESPATPLAVSGNVFDVVICQQGLQFFPDRLGALREMRRALKPKRTRRNSGLGSARTQPDFCSLLCGASGNGACGPGKPHDRAV